MNQKLKEKITESLSSVLPVTCIVLILGITIAPIPLDPLMLFLAGAAFLIIGMGFFTLGVDMAMMPIGEKVGAQLAKAKRLPIIILACIIMGAIVTVAEPDLQVLAGQTPAVPDMVLILTVAAGVGLFLALAFLRSLFGWSLSHILMVCYLILFIMAFYIPGDFLAVAFDSGGVTTGPITVPFIMALGMGLSSIGQGKNQDSDSFGLVALCSIGPILSVMILGFIYQSSSGTYEPTVILSISNSQDLWLAFQNELPEYAMEVFTALFPILIFFIIFQIFFLKMRKRQVVKILVGNVILLYWTDAVPHRGQRRVHARGQLPGQADRFPFLPVGPDPHRHAHWFLHCKGGTCRAGIKQAGGGGDGRHHIRGNHDERPVRWNGSFPGIIHASGHDRSSSYEPALTRICSGPGAVICGSSCLYFHCI